MRYLGILFDLDGTLVDSRADIAATVNRLRERRALAPLPLATVASFVGEGVTRLLGRALPGHEAELAELQQEFFVDYRDHLADRTTVYPGVQETLAALGGVSLGVLTNKPHELALKVLEVLGLARFFSAVYGGGSLPALKPDPVGVFTFAREKGVPLARLLLVGDHVTDLETGRNAGIDVCFCSFGIGQRGGFAPACVIARFPELLARVEG